MKPDDSKPAKRKTVNKRAQKPIKGERAGTSAASSEQRRLLFVELYIANGGNGSAAAEEAGYAPSSAHRMASIILARDDVKEMLKARRTVLQEKYELKSDSVIAALASIVYSDPRKAFDKNGALLPVHEWPDSVAAGIASIEVDEIASGKGDERVVIGHTKKVKFWDKVSAIDKAMKHLGLFEKNNQQKNPFTGMSEQELLQYIAKMSKALDVQ